MIAHALSIRSSCIRWSPQMSILEHIHTNLERPFTNRFRCVWMFLKVSAPACPATCVWPMMNGSTTVRPVVKARCMAMFLWKKPDADIPPGICDARTDI